MFKTCFPRIVCVSDKAKKYKIKEVYCVCKYVHEGTEEF